MTHIAEYKTKKSFREAVNDNPDTVWVTDPSIFNPITGRVPFVLDQGGEFTVTNHPKRSWFARVYYDKKRNIKVD